MDQLRQRGWSVSSNNEPTSNATNHDNDLTTRRPRANTDHSEDTLTAAEKRQLLADFPEDELIHVESFDQHDPSQNHREKEDDMDESNDNSDDSEQDRIELFGYDSNDDTSEFHDLQPAKKRRKICDEDEEINDTNSIVNNKDATLSEKEKLLEMAKSRMSKWATRLFDPNRPRGLVEAPEVIPLNDEFLKEFGNREKNLDIVTGRDIDIEHAIDDVDVNDDDSKLDLSSINEKTPKDDGFKVKIANLAFTTTKESILKACEKFGPVTDIIMPMDEMNANRSKGRAYVTFEASEDGEQFIKARNEKSFEGRILRVTMAEDRPKRGRDSLGGRLGGSALSRYWEKDITTKCFRCGGIGHMVDMCPNEAMPKPCPLCAKVGHDSYSCPLSKICFNCGVPGHINRECKERRGMPRRLVCGNCFISGHHRWECRERYQDIPSYKATCLECGRSGHFMCSQMRWFFGLNGLSCFNCGQAGHHGSKCERPKVDECLRNSDILTKELDRAEAISL
jgi:cellular nucleic acid-binding protein